MTKVHNSSPFHGTISFKPRPLRRGLDKPLRIASAFVFLIIGLLATPSLPAVASSLAPNQWACSVTDAAGGCSETPLAPLPRAESGTGATTAPCPQSMDTCVYVVANEGLVQAYDVVANSWISSSTAADCSSGELACPPLIWGTGFAVAEASCPGSSDACVYVLGGATAGSQTSVTAAVEAYDTKSNMWISSGAGSSCATSGPLPCVPTARTGLSAVTGACPRSDDRCIYVLGGKGDDGSPLATVNAYDPESGTWLSSGAGNTCSSGVVPCMPQARAGQIAAWAPCPHSQDYCIYTAGGSNPLFASTVQAYSPDSNTWISSDSGGSCASSGALACLPYPVSAAAGGTAPCPGTTDTCIYVMGGSNGKSAVATSQVYDPATNTWTSSGSNVSCSENQPACLPTGRHGLSMSAAPCPGVNATCLYTFGGVPTARKHALSIVEAYECQTVTDITLYVSPYGSDSNPGTYFFPYADLAFAQQQVEAMNADMSSNIDVYLENGTYRLGQPLAMGPADSGTNGFGVMWSAAPGEHAIVSGAQRIRGWTLSDASKDIWSAPVAAGLQTRQIYVNGVRASLASEALPVGLAKTATGYRAHSATMANWRNPSQIDFVYSGQVGLMAEPICPVASIKKKIITMAQPCWDNSIKRGRNLVGYGEVEAPTYLENAYQALGQPGQFYLDQTRHVLYYVPRVGQNMNTADVEVPALQSLIVGVGTAASPIHNIEFSNLQLSYATWLQPDTSDGFSEIQANYFITGDRAYATEGLCHIKPHGTCPYGAWDKEPGNVQFSYDRNITFDNDRFVHLGAAGLNLDNGSQNDSVNGSIFTDISGNGIEVGNVNLPRAKSGSQTTRISITDDHLYGLPVEYHGGVPILVGYASHCTISHNQIDHVSYAGISMGWGGWPDKDSKPSVANYSRNNIVSDNLIFDFMQTLADGGAVYTQGVTGTSMANGQQVTGNVIHDQLDWGYALHSDDGSTYVTYSSNVLWNNSYDFGSNHQDFRSGHQGTDDPATLTNNYWQQGYPNTSNKKLHILARYNHLISGPSQAPPSILSNAGLQPSYSYLLSWQPLGNAVPSEPDLTDVIYAVNGKAYLTWHPSVYEGSTPVTSYTITDCRVAERGPCLGPGGPATTVSASSFESSGYAVAPGLTNGTAYSFRVTANNSNGSSTPSIATGPSTPAAHHLATARKPRGIGLVTGNSDVRVLWYPPSNNYAAPPLAYKVTLSDGQVVTVSGLRQTMTSRSGGRILQVFDGLAPHQKVRFTLAAITPKGVGKPATTGWVTPS